MKASTTGASTGRKFAWAWYHTNRDSSLNTQMMNSRLEPHHIQSCARFLYGSSVNPQNYSYPTHVMNPAAAARQGTFFHKIMIWLGESVYKLTNLCKALNWLVQLFRASIASLYSCCYNVHTSYMDHRVGGSEIKDIIRQWECCFPVYVESILELYRQALWMHCWGKLSEEKPEALTAAGYSSSISHCWLGLSSFSGKITTWSLS